MTAVTRLLALLLSLAVFPGHAPRAQADEVPAREAWQALAGKSYRDKERAIELIARENTRFAYPAMKAMLAGTLYFSSQDKALFVLEKQGQDYTFSPLFGGQAIKQENKHGFKKVKINNRLRTRLRQALALLQLRHGERAARLGAIHELLKKPDRKSARLVRDVIENEADAEIRAAMQTLLAIVQLESPDQNEQHKAIATLAGSLNPSALNALTTYRAPNALLNKKARAAIQKIKDRRARYARAETIFFGLSLGSVLALAAIGLAITFGVMGVINMAHGELIMLGAYTTYVIQLLMPDQIGLSVIVAIPAAFIVSGLVGMAIEFSVIRHLYGRPLETLLASFGVSLVLQQAVRSIFSPLNRSVETPRWMSGAYQVNEVLALTWNRFYIIIFCVAVFLTLILVMKKTLLGLQVRAVSQNRLMARAMGVRSKWVDALTFGLGSGIAGMAGVALSLLTNVGPNLGQSYIIDSFMVVVFGGVGNLWGTLVAGMGLGVINKMLEPWAGAVLAKILLLVFIILFIQKRPTGLFPQRGRAAED
ncbi:MAG TPA: urea ABC transporter permease subunit UrtB [Gammaproteobacteria bacterium]|nr:urea ABC transporter permease subunit UrtB [Gammaproteobacteria bacterium]